MKVKRWFAAAVAVIGLLGGVLFGVAALMAQQASPWTPTVTTIASPASAGSGEPQLTVSDRGALLSWVEHNGPTMILRFAERTATGWTETRIVASGKDWSVNAMDVPTVLRLSGDTLTASWMQNSGAGMHANVVRLSYSRDDGRTWAPSFSAHQEGAPVERLFPSLFEMPRGGAGLIWLEGGPMQTTNSARPRSAATHLPGAEHTHQPAGRGQEHKGPESHGAGGGMGDGAPMSVRFASFDTAWKRTAETPIDLRVCECCPTAAAVTSEGAIAAYRNRGDEEIRDIYVSRFTQGRWSEPVPVYADNWKIAACPVNGPALSAQGANVAIAWYTLKQDQGHAYVAFSRDGGRTFGAPVRLDDGGSLGRVDVQVLYDGSALATWIEVGDGRSQFRTRRIAVDGTRSAAVTVSGLAAGRASGYPRVASHGDEVIFAWTETKNGTSRVRTAIARLPAVPAR